MARRLATLGLLSVAAYIAGLALACVLFDHHLNTLKET